MSERFRAIFDLKELAEMEECVFFDIGRLLAEETKTFQLGWPPIRLERRLIRIYSHRQGDSIRIFIPGLCQTLEYRVGNSP